MTDEHECTCGGQCGDDCQCRTEEPTLPDGKPLPKVWPEGCKLLILVDEAETETKGGIVVPGMVRDNNQLKLTMGTILRMGPDAVNNFAEGRALKPGSRVVFARYGGYRLKELETRRDLRIINDEDVLVLLEDDWV